MASYIEDWREAIKTLPTQIRSNFALIRQLDEATRGTSPVHSSSPSAERSSPLFCAGVTKIADELTESFVQAEKKRKRGGKPAKGRGSKGAESKLRKRVGVECPFPPSSQPQQLMCTIRLSRSNTRSTPVYKLPTKRSRFRSKVTTSLIIM